MPEERLTGPTTSAVEEHLAAVPDPRRRADAEAAVALLRRVTGVEPVLWGPSTIGVGSRPYRTADGREHDWFAVGLAARKAALTFYGLLDHGDAGALLARLGPHSTGKGCLYVKRLESVDLGVLEELVARAWAGPA